MHPTPTSTPLVLSADDRLWLSAAAKPGFFPRAALDALAGQIAPDFQPGFIDFRLYTAGRITPVGLWFLDPQHPALRVLDKVIRAIKVRIPPEDVPVTITAEEIAQAIQEDKKAVELAFQHLLDLSAGFFENGRGPGSESGAGFHSIDFNPGNLFTGYRKYVGMDDLLKRVYEHAGKDPWSPIVRPAPTQNEDIAETPLTPKPPDVVLHLLWFRQNLVRHWGLISLAATIAIAAWVINGRDWFGDAKPAAATTATREATPPSDEEDFHTVKVIPGWDATNAHWPMIPAEQPTFQAKLQAVMNECATCIAMSDHSRPAEDGMVNRAGSYAEFDARKCQQIIRLAMRAVRLRKAVGAPPAIAEVFDLVDLNPGMVTKVSTGDVTAFSAAPVQCLK